MPHLCKLEEKKGSQWGGGGELIEMHNIYPSVHRSNFENRNVFYFFHNVFRELIRLKILSFSLSSKCNIHTFHTV